MQTYLQGKISHEFFLSICNSIEPLFFLNKPAEDLKVKGKKGPVTEVDLMVSEFLYERLREFGYLDTEILSEENTSTYVSDANRLWILDPLDGTKEFIKGVPEFSFSLGYLENKKLIAGCVFNPVNKFFVSSINGEIYSKNKNLLMYCKDQILCSRSEMDKGLLEGRSFPYKILGVGSIAYKLALVAAGFAKATVSFQPKSSWDIAAGVALVEAAGGKVTDLEGNPLSFSQPSKRFEKGILASMEPNEHTDLLKICRI